MSHNPKGKQTYRGRSVVVALTMLFAICSGYFQPVAAEMITKAKESAECSAKIEKTTAEPVFSEPEYDYYPGKITIIKRMTEQELLNAGAKTEYRYKLKRFESKAKPENTSYKTLTFDLENYRIDQDGFVSVSIAFHNLVDGNYRLTEMESDSYNMKDAGQISSNAYVGQNGICFTIDSSDMDNKNAYQGIAVFISEKNRPVTPDTKDEFAGDTKIC